MAAAAIPFISFTIFVSLFASSLSRASPEKTTVLDVSGSLQQALNILSFDPQKPKPFFSQQDEQLSGTATTPFSSNSSFSFSLELRSRETLHKTKHKDYKSLVLSRLERDSARVMSLTARLQLALDGVSKFDLKPMGTDVSPKDLSTPVTSGSTQGSGEYFSRVGVGNPAKPYYLVLDTGSDISWLQCQPCTDCYQQVDPVFDPTESSSYSPVGCGSQQCSSLETSSCQSGQCLYQVNYGDGSFTYGEFVTETLSFGSSGNADNIALGCGHDNEGLFVASAGLLGLGGGPLSLTSQVKASSFSYCLVNRNSAGSSTLDFNSASDGDTVVATLLRNPKIDTFYYVELTGMSVGGRLLPIPQSVFRLDGSGNGGIIVDCGTAVTRLQTEAYNLLRDSFVSLTRHLQSTGGVALFDTCYDLSGQTSVRVPTVSFHFGDGRAWDLPAANYLIPIDSAAGTYCFAFAPTTSSLSIIGNVQQQGTRVSFDLANKRVGFSTNKC